MANHEHPDDSDPDQPDQVDKPYSGLGMFTQMYLKHIAIGHLDSSMLSTEELGVLDSAVVKMFADIQFLIEHGELPPGAGPPPELLQDLEAEDHNGTPPSPENQQ